LIDIKRGEIRHKRPPCGDGSPFRWRQGAILYRVEIKEKTRANRRFILRIR
jgi:hypothetical protein